MPSRTLMVPTSLALNMGTAVVDGAAAGNVTVAGIKTFDQLLAVIHFDPTAPGLFDRTAEFTITADDTINNTGGTSTSGDRVMVLWMRNPNQ